MKGAISFIGYHNSGKTTLLRRVAGLLKKKGYRIGVIKSTKHSVVELDTKDKDSSLFSSDALFPHAVVARDAIILYLDRDTHDPLKILERILPGTDVLLLEGFKRAIGIPKIEVYRTGVSEDHLFPKVEGVAAIVTDEDEPCFSPHFSFENIEQISGFIINSLPRQDKEWGQKGSIELLVDGHSVYLNRFVRESLKGAILGYLSAMKGAIGKKITITIEG